MKTTAKRRRSRKQIEADKANAIWEKAETARKIQRLEQMEQEQAAMKQKIELAEAQHSIV